MLRRGIARVRRLSAWSHIPAPPSHDAQNLSTLDAIPAAWLRAEAAYCRAALRPLTRQQSNLYERMTGRLPAELRTPGEPIGEYLYYTRTPHRRDLPLHCRQLISGGPEQVLLDLSALADQHGFAALGAISVSEDHSLLAYTLDLTGTESWELRVVEAATGRLVSSIPNVLSVEWASGEELVYTQMDGRSRPCHALVHTAGSSSSSDAMIFDELDEAAIVDVATTKSRRWLTINSNTRASSEVHLLSASDPRGPLRLVAPRESGISYFVEQLGYEGWLLLIANASAESRALGLSAVHESQLPAKRSSWTTLRPPNEDEPVDDVDVFAQWLVLYERAQGVPRARVLSIRGDSESDSASSSSSSSSETARVVPSLSEHSLIPLPTGDAPCAISPAPNRSFSSDVVHFEVSSPTTPPTPLAYDMRLRNVWSRAPPLEPLPRTPLVCEQWHAPARDGAQVPLTVVRRADVQPSANTPLHMLVYGAYGASLGAEWRAEHLPLLESGWMVVLAHVRGGGELGPKWHRAGAGLAKQTSANDLCDVLQWMHAHGTSRPERTTAAADSAGGLALGGLMNALPGGLAAAVLRGAFLDPLDAMLDPSLPLTIEEREEWGDPLTCKATRAAMATYSPYEGLPPGTAMPALLLIAAAQDTRVPLAQSLKYVSRLRRRSLSGLSEEAVLDRPPALLHVRESGGHQGEGGRYRRFEQVSVELSFLMHAVGESSDS